MNWFFPQDQNEPFADKKIGKQYIIQRINIAPIIDGSLDDPIWSNLLPITDFFQENPSNMEDPTEKTVVYLAYNENSILKV